MRKGDLFALLICSVFMVFGFSLANTKEKLTADDFAAPLKVYFVDVGQGDAIFFEEGNNQLLLDGGPSDAIIDFLGQTMPPGDKIIEKVIISHPHADHLRGINKVLGSYDVGEIYFNGVSYSSPEFNDFLGHIKSKNIQPKRLYKGKKLEYLGASIDVLWPPKDISKIKNVNDSSLILDLTYGKSEIILPGDAGVEPETIALRGTKDIDILKISHHGSKTGTNENLLEELSPLYAVITVGKNSYGHPAPSVLNILMPYKSLRTDQDQNIVFGITQGGVILY